MNKKRLILPAAACVLALGAFAGGAMAYLTDVDTATNTFTVGEIRIDTLEPNYPGNGSDETTDLVAMQEVPKDPEIKNTGKNRAICFIQVDIPMADLITAQEDGTRNEQANTELFNFRTTESEFDSVDDKWVLLETTYLDEYGNTMDEKCLTYRDPKYPEGTEAPGDAGKQMTEEEMKATAGFTRRLYGYETVVEEDETTEPVFDVVRLANIVEDFVDNSTQDIIITSYSIQADNIQNITNAHWEETMDEETLSDIFRVYMNQSGKVNPSDADTSNSQTLKHSTLNVSMSIDNRHLKLNTGDANDTKTVAHVKVAYTGKNTTPDYTFTTSNPDVATIDNLGNIQAKAVGETVITVTAVNPDTGKTASASVTVTVRDMNTGE